MTERELIPLTDPSQVPENMTEHEAHEFWSTHEITEEFWEKAEPVPEDELPRPMSREELLRRRRKRWKR